MQVFLLSVAELFPLQIIKTPRHVMHWRQAVAESIGFDFFGLKLVKEKKPESHKYSCDKEDLSGKWDF